MRKTAYATLLILALLFSVLAGPWFINLGEANPEPWTQNTTGGWLSIYIFSPESQTYPTNTINLTMHVDYHLGVLYIQYSVDGNPWRYLYSEYLYREKYGGYGVTETIPLKLSDGSHTIIAKAQGLGAKVCTNVTFTIDTITPHLSIVLPKNQTYNTAEIPLDFTAFRLSNIRYSLDGKANVSTTGKTILKGVPDGFHSIIYYGASKDGTTYASDIIYFGVDTGPPKFTVLSIENKTYYTRNLTLNFTVNEPFTEIVYSIDWDTPVAIKGNVTLPELSYGTHTLKIYLRDAVSGVLVLSSTVFSIAEPFPTTLVIASVITATVVGIGLLVYLKKHKR